MKGAREHFEHSGGPIDVFVEEVTAVRDEGWRTWFASLAITMFQNPKAKNKDNLRTDTIKLDKEATKVVKAPFKDALLEQVEAAKARKAKPNV